MSQDASLVDLANINAGLGLLAREIEELNKKAPSASELGEFAEQKAKLRELFNLNTYLFADAGYPPYGSTLVTRQDVIEQRPEVLKRFVKASMQGWKNYLANPAPANALIKQDNPSMDDELLAWGVAKLKEYQLVEGGDAAIQGIGTISAERWQKTRDFMVETNLLKADTDWRKAFNTDFVRDLRVLPAAPVQAANP